MSTAPLPAPVPHGHVPPSRIGGPDGPPDTQLMLKALRRRWPLALAFGVLAASAAGPAAWHLFPQAKYSTNATIQVASHPHTIIFQTRDSQPDPLTYQRTQAVLVKNRKVLAETLRRPDVARLEMVRRQVDPEEWLAEQLLVSFVGGPEVLQVSLSGDRPEDLKTIVNAVVDSYMALIVEGEHRTRLDRLETLKRLRDRYQKELASGRKSLREVVAAVGLNDQKAIGMAQQFKAEQLAMTQRELIQTRSQLTKARAELKALEEGPGTGHDPDVPEDVIREATERRADVAEQRGLTEKAAQHHQAALRPARDRSDPSVVEARRRWEAATIRLAQLRARASREIAAQLSGRSIAARAEETARALGQAQALQIYQDALEKDVKNLREETKDISEKGLDLDQERAELAIRSGVAQTIGSEVEAIEVELGAPPRVQKLADARAPGRRDEFRKLKAGGAAAAGAFLLATFCISFWESRARRVDSTTEVIQGLGARIVGVLPAHPARRPSGTPLDTQRWDSILIESIDAARTIILHACREESIRIIMVTSASKGEGKTTLACHLAASLARSGRGTILVDGDLRRPSMHQLFDQTTGPGLCDLLRAEAELDEVIRETPLEGLSLIPAGRCDNAALLGLAQDALPPILRGLRAQYDFIVVDTAPVLPVVDTLLIGQHVDAAVFAVLRGVSRLPEMCSAYDRLASLGIRMLGAVVAGVKMGGYGSRYYYDAISPPK